VAANILFLNQIEFDLCLVFILNLECVLISRFMIIIVKHRCCNFTCHVSNIVDE